MLVLGLRIFLSTKCHLRCFSSNNSYIVISGILTFCLSLYLYLLLCFKTHFLTQVTEASICFSKITLQVFKITLSLFWANLASPVNHFLIASLKQEISSSEWSPEVICSSAENTIWKQKSDKKNKPPIPQNISSIRNAISSSEWEDLKTPAYILGGGVYLTRKEGDLTAKVDYKRKKIIWLVYLIKDIKIQHQCIIGTHIRTEAILYTLKIWTEQQKHSC